VNQISSLHSNFDVLLSPM